MSYEIVKTGFHIIQSILIKTFLITHHYTEDEFKPDLSADYYNAFYFIEIVFVMICVGAVVFGFLFEKFSEEVIFGPTMTICN